MVAMSAFLRAGRAGGAVLRSPAPGHGPKVVGVYPGTHRRARLFVRDSSVLSRRRGVQPGGALVPFWDTGTRVPRCRAGKCRMETAPPSVVRRPPTPTKPNG